MDITFNPSIGDSVQLETSFSSQTAALHFTAELTAHDHNELVQNRARIQLWSDIPYVGQSLSGGEWGALDLMDQAQFAEETSSHKVSLGSTYHAASNEEKVRLFLEVVAVLPMDRIPRFSFTYRIVYPSGDIKWLGAFGQNGSLSFERSDNDLRNFGLDSWTWDNSKMAYVYEVKQSVGASGVAKVKDIYNYCIRAIGPTRFVSDLKEAALLFFVPRPQPSAVSLLPTYVISASQGVSLAVSLDGQITASGSGTLLFQANESHLEPLTFLHQVLSHAELDSWNVLACHGDSKVIVLATPKEKFPIKAVTLPLWHSIRPIYLKTATLSDILGSAEFSIFSPDNLRIHLFAVDKQKKQMISLQFDSTGNTFVMSPIYTLRGQTATNISPVIWKTVILSPYQIQDFPSDDSSILPTPPPSPHLQLIASPSQSHTLSSTAMSSVPSFPSDTCISLQSPIDINDEPGTLPASSINLHNTDTHDTLPMPKCSNSPVPQSMITVLISLLFSRFFSIFYRLFWGSQTSGPSRDNTTEDRPQSLDSMGLERDVHSPFEDAPDHCGDRICASEKIPGTLEGIEIKTTSPSDVEIPETVTGYAIPGVSRASDNRKGGGDMLYYLQSEPRDSNSQKTITIAILCSAHNDFLAADDTTNSNTSIEVMDKNGIMKRCVQFLDGTEPECVVRRCDVDAFYHDGVPREEQNDRSYSCRLLQYQLDWGRDLEKSERTVRISPPVSIS